MEAILGGTGIVSFLCMLCGYSAESYQGAWSISNQLLLYFTIPVHRHLFLYRYLYSLSIHDSNKTLNIKCSYIVTAQYNKDGLFMSLAP